MTNPTTKAVLDAMKADAARRGASIEPPAEGYAKAAPEVPRVPVKPMSGDITELLSEHQVYEKAQVWKMHRASPEELKEWRERIAAAPAKIAAAKERGADPSAVKKAEATIAELQDRLKAAILAEAKWYMLHTASQIMADFGRPDLKEAFTDTGGTLTFDVPGVLTFRADLTSYEEIPF